MTLDDDRIGALAATKLQGLLRANEVTEIDASPSAARATAVVGDCLWVYQPRNTTSALAAGLLLAARHGASGLAVVVDEVPDDLPFSLAGLDGVEAYRTVDAALVPIEAAPAPDVRAPAPDHPLLPVLVSAGLDVVPGDGIWLGEVLGLEVVRLVGAAREIQLGVGAYDRGAFEALYPDQSPIDALPRVIAQVRDHRHAGAPPHLLNRLVRERWIRSELCARPSMVGLDRAEPIAGLSMRAGLHETVPDAALGVSDDDSVLVVTSVGIDPQILTVVAALAIRHRVARAVIAVPHTDVHATVARATRFLSIPATVMGVEPPWD